MVQGQPVVAYQNSHADGSDGSDTHELLTQLTGQLSRLVRDELGLARHEMLRQAKRAGVGGGALSVAAMMGMFGAAALLVAAGLALAYLLPGWLAAVVVAGGALLVSGMSALIGLLVMRAARLAPVETVDNVRLDIQTVRESIKR